MLTDYFSWYKLNNKSSYPRPLLEWDDKPKPNKQKTPTHPFPKTENFTKTQRLSNSNCNSSFRVL